MSRIALALLVACYATLACKRPAPSVGNATADPKAAPSAGDSVSQFKMPEALRQYLSARPCTNRSKVIDAPEKYRDLLAREYAGTAADDCDWLGTGKIRAVDATTCDDALANGRLCTVAVWRADAQYGLAYCIRRTPQGDVVDWPCSTGHSDTELGVFKATGQPGEHATFRLWAELDDSYDYDFANARATHYSLKLTNEANSVSAHGYLRKDAADAPAVLAELKAGKGVRFCVVLELPKPLRSASVTRITAMKVGWSCDELSR